MLAPCSTRGWSIPDKLRHFSLPNEKGCHIWQGLKNRDGYGRIGLGRNKHFFAHKVSWKNSFGPIPKGMCVLHTCDVPSCINPDHLFLGTHEQNMGDMAQKLRAAKKLTPDLVRAIRSSLETQHKTAKKYGIHQATVWEILHGKIWSHVK